MSLNRRWHFILPTIAINVVLIAVAVGRWNELSHFATELNTRVPPKAQADALDILEQAAAMAAKEHNIDLLEKARSEQAMNLLQGDLKPNLSTALYFYPETLPHYSLERDFAIRSLKPGIKALQDAFKQRQPASTQKAYRVLEARVTNYEGGASATPEEISPEAQAFLRVYGHFKISERKTK